MAPHVEESLTAPERVSLLDDTWALVRAGRQSAADYLTLASGFGLERSSGVMSMVRSRLTFVHDYLTTDATRARFEAFVRTLLRPSLSDRNLMLRPTQTRVFQSFANPQIAPAGSRQRPPENIHRLAQPILGREHIGKFEILFHIRRFGVNRRQQFFFLPTLSLRLCRCRRCNRLWPILCDSFLKLPRIRRALQNLFVVPAFLDRPLDAQLRDCLARLLITRLCLLDTPPATDRLIKLPEPR